MDSRNIKLAIIIPTLNEKDICCCLEELVSSIRDCEYEVVIVDDSTDDTVQRIEDYKINSGNTRISVIKGKGEGLGSAIREGSSAVDGDIIFYMDGDMRIPLENIEKFVSFISDEGYQIVVAERSFRVSYRSPLRLVLSIGLFIIQRVFVFNSSQFHDTQCGFRAYKSDAFKQIVDKQRVNGGMYTLEHLYIARKNGMRIARVHVYPQNEIRKSKIKVLSCMLKDPVDIVRIKVNGLLGRYGRCLLADRHLS